MLTAEVHERLWVPPGCAHGFLVVSEIADFHYKVSSAYSPADERSLRWDDPTLSITWPIEIGISPLVSPKDAIAASFEDCEKYD
jgi:dTDP-4-dehydrorhamnose 3,5-epimerase